MKYRLKNNEPFEVRGAIDNVEKVVNVLTLGDSLDNKQDTLVSGTNIKSLNNTSLLGSGNLDLNPLIFITFWQTDQPAVPSSGQYWYNS